MSSSSSQSGSSSAPPEYWLLKVPNFLHDQWEEAKRNNTIAAANPMFAKSNHAQSMYLGNPVAHILVEKKPKPGTARRMKLVVPTASTTALSMTTTTPLPNEFSFQPKPKSTMLVFGASVPPSATQLAIANAKTAANPTRPQPTPEAFKLDGEVTLMADCLPRTDTPQYKAMLAARLAKSITSQKTTKPLDESKDIAVTPMMNMYPVKRKLDSLTGGSRNTKPEKRVRMEENELERAILDIMSQPQHAAITISKLTLQLQQPLSAVSEMVKRLCVKLEEGVNKGLYVLKPEYQLATDLSSDNGGLVANGGAPMSSSSSALDISRPNPVMQSMMQVKTEVKREY